ncbi:hypothetical protein PpBr36_05061 [Pyricularia pennisetigena]|uniref:hypothetical protein n=1 Tax=Pyricularia pennisetigena TaxID=1578925 RepID=UPI00114FF263|nr:hypothetical protein PpBr36_05061 [Pyricularia pennisetigena]TLS26191.1 hypothetical protein PpBr36_05061 [Pyricularia pennisetigena]
MVNRAKTPKCGSPQGSDTLISDANSDHGSCSGSFFSGASNVVAPGIPPASRPAAKARRVAKKSLGTQEVVSKNAEADEYEIPGASPPPRPKRPSKPIPKPPTNAKTPSPPAGSKRVGKEKLFKRVYPKQPEPLRPDAPAATHKTSDMKNPAQDSDSSPCAINEGAKGTPSLVSAERGLESVPQLLRSSPTSLPKFDQSDKPSGNLVEEEKSEGAALDGPSQMVFPDISSLENVVSKGTLSLLPETKHRPANYLTSHDTGQPDVAAIPGESPNLAFAPVDINRNAIVRDTYGAASSPVNLGTTSLKRPVSPTGPDYQKRARISPKVQSQQVEEPKQKFVVPRKPNHSLIDLNARYERLRHPDVPLDGQTTLIPGTPGRKPGKALLQRFAEDDQEPTVPILEKDNVDSSDPPFNNVNFFPAKCNNLGRDNDCPSNRGIADSNKQPHFEGEWWETIRAILQNALDDMKCREGLLDMFVSDLMSLERQLLSVIEMHREDQASILRICREKSQNIMRQCDKGRDSLRRIAETARMTDIKRILIESQSRTERLVQVLEDSSRT